MTLYSDTSLSIKLVPLFMYLSDLHLASASLYKHCFHFMWKLISFWIYFADTCIENKKTKWKRFKGSLSASFTNFYISVALAPLWSMKPRSDRTRPPLLLPPCSLASHVPAPWLSRCPLSLPILLLRLRASAKCCWQQRRGSAGTWAEETARIEQHWLKN